MAREGYTSITLDDETARLLQRIQQKENLKTTPEAIRFLARHWNVTKEDFETKMELILQLLESERSPFAYFALESNLTGQEIDKIYDLMDEAEKKIREGKPMPHHEFERRVYVIIPRRRGDYHFAEGIVGTLHKEGRWEAVYVYYKDHGMNLSPLTLDEKYIDTGVKRYPRDVKTKQP